MQPPERSEGVKENYVYLCSSSIISSNANQSNRDMSVNKWIGSAAQVKTRSEANYSWLNYVVARLVCRNRIPNNALITRQIRHIVQ